MIVPHGEDSYCAAELADTPNPIGQLTPVPARPQYPFGTSRRHPHRAAAVEVVV